MSGETGLALLPASADRAAWTPRQRAVMEAIGLQGTKRVNRGGNWVDVEYEAPVGVVEMFLSTARRLGLDPMAKQIYCIERGGKWGIQASIDGFRLTAERSKKYKGQTAPQWCGRDGVWRDVWLDPEEPPAAARIGVRREDFDDILWAVATYDGYCPRDKDNNLKPTNQWLTNPANQLVKCAEMLALRKAFPQDLSGIYGAEEMDQSEPVDITATTVDVTGQTRTEPQSAYDTSALDGWRVWRDAIDGAPDKKALGELYQQARDILNNRIPEEIEGHPDVKVVGDYFMIIAAVLPDSVEDADPNADDADPQTGEVPDGKPQEPAGEPQKPRSTTKRSPAKKAAEKPAQPAEKGNLEPVTEWPTADVPQDGPATEAGSDDVPF